MPLRCSAILFRSNLFSQDCLQIAFGAHLGDAFGKCPVRVQGSHGTGRESIGIPVLYFQRFLYVVQLQQRNSRLCKDGCSRGSYPQKQLCRRAYPLLAASIAKVNGGVHKNNEQLFLFAGRNSKIETCKRAVPSESNGVDRRDPVLKLSQLLLAAAILIALVLLAFEMMLG